MKRLALFAGFDKDNEISSYVVHYLRELSKCADIIYVADNTLSQTQLAKISDFTLKIIAAPHGEYDFGSYKRAYCFAKESGILSKYDALILCNDSVFGPFYAFDEIFAKIPPAQDIVYGFSKHLQAPCNWARRYKIIQTHLQSYFIVMPKAVFLSEWFDDFITSIKKEQDKIEIVFKYEIGMSKLFEKHGIKLISQYESELDLSRLKPLEVLSKHKGAFLKKTLISQFSFNEIYKILEFINRNYGGGGSYYGDLILNYYEQKFPPLYLMSAKNIKKAQKLSKKVSKIAKFIPTKYLRKRFFEKYILEND